MTATKATPGGTKRYAPWLQKALLIKNQTDAFWTKERARQSHEQERRQSQVDVESHEQRKNSINTVRTSKRKSDATTHEAHPHHDTHTKVTDTNTMEYSSIWDAVAADDVAVVTQTLEATPASVFQRNDVGSGGGGVTMLHEAAWHGARRVVDAILRHLEAHFPSETRRAYVNWVDTLHSQTTPLIAACRGAEGDMKTRLEIVTLLIQAGADVERQDAHGDNAIHWCARMSNNMILRHLLKETDAGANAVFAENYKREKPLEIAKHQLTSTNSAALMMAQNVYNSLRSIDRKCNMRLKMQVIKRHSTQLHNERVALLDEQLATTLANADELIEQAERMWNETLAHAETNRKEAETLHTNTVANAARGTAIQWLDTKDGKAYIKKQQAIATDELKLEIQRGKVAKPKDIKKAATQYACDTYIRHQEETARKNALDDFRTKRPAYPTDPAKLRSILS